MSENTLDINSSPEEHSEGITGVKKLNKLPLILFLVIVLVIILSIAYALISKGQKNENEVYTNQKNVDKNNDSDKLIQELLAKSLKKKEKPKVEIKEERKTSIENNYIPPLNKSSIKHGNKSALPMKKSLSEREKLLAQEEARLLEMKKQMLHDAILSSTKVQGSTFSTKSQNNTGGLLGTDGLPAGAGASLGIIKDYMKQSLNKPKDEVDIRSKNEIFIDKSEKSFAYLSHSKTDLVSKFEIKTGTIIPGILITGINSELPGQVLAQVSENVYDTATGQYLLIPQGTKILGMYNASVKYGQSRLLLVWNRLIFPSGKTLNIGSMLGSDKEGYSGFDDQVDNHYFRIFGSAFLLSLIGGDIMFKDGKLYLASGDAKDGVDRKESLLEKTGVKMIEKNMNLAPTITIRSGYKFNIFVTKDMILEPLEF